MHLGGVDASNVTASVKRVHKRNVSTAYLLRYAAITSPNREGAGRTVRTEMLSKRSTQDFPKTLVLAFDTIVNKMPSKQQ